MATSDIGILSLNNHDIRKYEMDIMHISQQKYNPFEGKVTMVEDFTGVHKEYPHIEDLELYLHEEMAQQTPIEHAKQKFYILERNSYSNGTLFDKYLINRDNPLPQLLAYQRLFGYAVNRNRSKVIYKAIKGGAKTKTNKVESTENLDTNHTIAHANTGMTVDKLSEGVERLSSSYNYTPDNIYCLMTSKQMRSLANSVKDQDSEIFTTQVLKTGMVNNLWGVKLGIYEEVDKSGTTFDAILWNAEDILVTQGMVNVEISERADLSHSIQLFVIHHIGAIRVRPKSACIIQSKQS